MSSLDGLRELCGAGFDDFIFPAYEDVAHTSIQNRSKINRSLAVALSGRRVLTQNLNLLPYEFGPDGEPVYELQNKDPRFRVVGSGWKSFINDQGTKIHTTRVGDFIEIAAYCTGLNVLVYQGSGTGDFRTTVDDGAESTNQYTANSTVLDARNYGKNTSVNVAKGLTLGMHTFKIRVGASSSNGLVLYGFEIISEEPAVYVRPGLSVVKGGAQTLNALAASDYKEGIIGSRGARVVKYLQNGKIKSAVQETDLVAKFLTQADHTNEEVFRRINFREFGANRADDYSTLSTTGSNRAFTLDDGTTSLVGQNNRASDPTGAGVINIHFIGGGSAADYFTHTFVGTGLDVLAIGDGNAARQIEIFVDGVSLGVVAGSSITGVKVMKICSGLPYGTHTVKFKQNAAATNSWGVADFIVYQPKRPSVPASGAEFAEFCVLADYKHQAGTQLAEDIATGVIHKPINREVAFAGSGTWSLALSTLRPGGFEASNSTLGAYLELTFFGEGIIIRESTSSSTTNIVSIDGSTDFTNYSVTTRSSGAGSFNSSTGAYLSPPGSNNSLEIRGLPLGVHTIRILNNTGGTGFAFNAFDIITPVYYQSPSLRLGNTGHNPLEKITPKKDLPFPLDLSDAKAWLFYDSAGTKILASHNIRAVVPAGTGSILVYFEVPFKNEDYVIICSGNNFEVGANLGGKKAHVVNIVSAGSGGTAATSTFVSATFFGELIDEQ